jgi:hypothetical protein
MVKAQPLVMSMEKKRKKKERLEKNRRLKKGTSFVRVLISV